jgi:hypothetical protein
MKMGFGEWWKREREGGLLETWFLPKKNCSVGYCIYNYYFFVNIVFVYVIK